MKIAVIGMLCEPSGASEGSVSWKWALAYKALGHEVELFTSNSQRNFFDQQDLSKLTVHFLGSEITNDKSPHSVTQAFRLMMQLRRWNLVLVGALPNLKEFDFVHQVSISTIRVRTSLKPLQEQLVWGPLGGAHFGILQGLHGLPWLFEGLRNLSVIAAKTAASLRGAMSDFRGAVLVTNSETERYAKKIGAEFVFTELSDGLTPQMLSPVMETLPHNKLGLIWAGRLVASKRPDLSIRALHSLRQTRTDVSLMICGDGPERLRLEGLAADLGVREYVTFTGRVSPEKMTSLMRKSSLCLFTSQRDSSSPLLLEALGLGIPCTAIRIQGVATCFPEHLVPGPPYLSNEKRLVEELCKSIQISSSLAEPEQRINFAASHLWTEKAKRVISRWLELHNPTIREKN